MKGIPKRSKNLYHILFTPSLEVLMKILMTLKHRINLYKKISKQLCFLLPDIPLPLSEKSTKKGS